MSENTNNTPATSDSIQDLGIPQIGITLSPSEVIYQGTDSTLTSQGQPADAYAVGQRFAEVEDDISDLATDLLAVEGQVGNALLKTAQTLDADEKTQVMTNLGLGVAATKSVANNLTTATAGVSVLDAAQGKALSDSINAISSGLGTAAGYAVANDLTTSTSGSKVLDAAQGKTLKDGLDTLGASVVKVESQTLSTAQKEQARANIDVPSTSDVVKVNASQSLTSTQQAQARTNIDVPSTSEAVLANTSQSFTDSQKSTARTNIGALGAADAVLISAQTLTTSQQEQARTNIGAASAKADTLLNSTFLIRNYTCEQNTIAANGTASYTALDFAIETISGYSILGLFGYSTGTSSLCAYYIDVRASGTGNAMMVKNITNEAINPGAAILRIVYVRSELIGV